MENWEWILNPIDWAGVAAITSVGMFILNIVLLVTVIIGYRSITEAVKTRDSTLLLWAMDEMGNIKPDLLVLNQAGPFSIGKLGEPDFKILWSEDQLAAANRVSIVLQRLGYMATAELISKEHFAELWGPVVISAWKNSKEFVFYKRFQNGEPVLLDEGGFIRKDFEKYAKHCLDRV